MVPVLVRLVLVVPRLCGNRRADVVDHMRPAPVTGAIRHELQRKIIFAGLVKSFEQVLSSVDAADHAPALNELRHAGDRLRRRQAERQGKHVCVQGAVGAPLPVNVDPRLPAEQLLIERFSDAGSGLGESLAIASLADG